MQIETIWNLSKLTAVHLPTSSPTIGFVNPILLYNNKKESLTEMSFVNLYNEMFLKSNNG